MLPLTEATYTGLSASLFPGIGEPAAMSQPRADDVERDQRRRLRFKPAPREAAVERLGIVANPFDAFSPP